METGLLLKIVFQESKVMNVLLLFFFFFLKKRQDRIRNKHLQGRWTRTGCICSPVSPLSRRPQPLSRLGWKEDQGTGAHPAFSKHCRAESSCRRTSPQGLREEQR